MRPPTPAGAHFLSPRLAERLVRDAGVERDDLVLDLGAGGGAVTAPLAATGARVLAVERDGRAAAKLTRRFSGTPTVRVVHGDICTVPLPRRPFRVVSNIPFGVTTRLLQRLLDGTALQAADLILADGAVRGLTAHRPGDAGTLRWSLRYSLERGRSLPARCFSPPPSVDACVLVVRRRNLVAAPARRAFLSALATGYRRPGVAWERSLRDVLTRPQARRVAHERRLEFGRPARELSAGDWAAIATVLTRRC